MSKSARQANRKAAIFSATLLGTLLLLAVTFATEPLQQADAQQLADNAPMPSMSAYSPDVRDEIADMFLDANDSAAGNDELLD